MTYDFVVIGAGAAGMTSALILAQKGLRVALVEKSPRLAPLMRGFSRREIFFDTGFHYSGCLADGEALDTFLRYLGLADRLEKRPYARDGFDIVRSRNPQWEFRFPWGEDDVRQKLHERFPAETLAIDSYLDTVFRVCDTTPFMNLALDLDEAPQTDGVYDQPLQAYLDRLTDNDELKGLLSLHCLLYGVSPAEVPLGHHALIVAPYYRSTYGIRGGGGSVVQAFAAELERLNVDIRCGQGVEEILFDADGTLSGVRLAEGEVLSSEGCISTVHPHCFVDMVPEHRLRPAFKKRLSRVDHTSSAFILYGGCRGSLEFLSESNMFFISEPARAAALGNGTLEDRPLYLTAAWDKSGAQATPGFVAICPASYEEVKPWGDSSFGDRPEDYRRFKADIVDRLGRHLEQICPELRGEVAWLEGATPLTVRDFVYSPFGSLYGAKRRVGQQTVPPLTRYKGLFLAGQAVTAPGLMGAMISGIQACGHIFGHEQIFEDLRRCN